MDTSSNRVCPHGCRAPYITGCVRYDQGGSIPAGCPLDATIHASSNSAAEIRAKREAQVSWFGPEFPIVPEPDDEADAIPNRVRCENPLCIHADHPAGDVRHVDKYGCAWADAIPNSAAEPGQAHRTVELVCTVEYKDWQIDGLARQFVRALESTISRWPEVTTKALRIDADATRNSVRRVIEIELHPDVTENEAERISYAVAEVLRNDPAVHWVQVAPWEEADA